MHICTVRKKLADKPAEVFSVTPDTPVLKAVRLMAERHFAPSCSWRTGVWRECCPTRSVGAHCGVFSATRARALHAREEAGSGARRTYSTWAVTAMKWQTLPPITNMCQIACEKRIDSRM